MHVAEQQPPRAIVLAGTPATTLHHTADIALAPDELVTFVTASGTQYDVTRKAWGYYATPSLNGRLPAHGLRPALMRNTAGKYFVALVERGQEAAFAAYLTASQQVRVAWLDDAATLAQLDHSTESMAE